MRPTAVAATPRTGPAFLITIDTEGDNLWGRPRTIETRNTAFLARFQNLCDDFGFKPTWLTNHEMAMDPAFVRFGREAARRDVAEIGMHLHAWNSPPLVPLTDDDFHHQPFLIEYPADVVEAKISAVTALLRDRFEGGIVSHRAGRWALDSTYVKLLAKYGYRVDCSVTPHVSWTDTKGSPAGAGGTDFSRFPSEPYMLDPEHIDRAGNSPILELPVSIIPSSLRRIAPLAYRVPGVRRWAWKYRPELLWLYPDGKNLAHMLEVVRDAVVTKKPYVELVLHSSELMPGGSPLFPDAARIDALYRDLRALFGVIAQSFKGMTLSEFRAAWMTPQRVAWRAAEPVLQRRAETPGLHPGRPLPAVASRRGPHEV